MATNYVQGAITDSSGTSAGVQFTTANITASNLLFLAVRIGTTSTTSGVSDTNSNGWTKITSAADANTGDTLETWYAQNAVATPNGKPIVTVTSTTSATLRIILEEYSGVATSGALGVQGTNGLTSNTTPTATSSGSVTQATQLLIGVAELGNAETYTPGGGMTLGDVVPAVSSKLGTEWLDLAAASGTQTISFNISNPENWNAAVVTFNAAGSAPAFVRPKITVSREAQRRASRW